MQHLHVTWLIPVSTPPGAAIAILRLCLQVGLNGFVQYVLLAVFRPKSEARLRTLSDVDERNVRILPSQLSHYLFCRMPQMPVHRRVGQHKINRHVLTNACSPGELSTILPQQSWKMAATVIAVQQSSGAVGFAVKSGESLFAPPRRRTATKYSVLAISQKNAEVNVLFPTTIVHTRSQLLPHHRALKHGLRSDCGGGKRRRYTFPLTRELCTNSSDIRRVCAASIQSHAGTARQHSVSITRA